ncbi:MAG: ribonuclease HII [Chlorobium sp.]|nr:MAG: ribonuclease HII [Chlorobium sp.]
MNTNYEWPLWQHTGLICGIDEAGRGPLAGPVVAAAVLFPRWFRPEGALLEMLDDSKKLTANERELLAPAIRKAAISWAIAAVEHDTIDSINILQSTMLAMNRAVEGLSITPQLLLVDGNRFTTSRRIPFETIVKGDSKVFSIAAASVLAKTHRDEVMVAYGAQYPHYGFERHAGYATKAHIEAIRVHGRCPIHRLSFRLRQLGEKP